ncbi:MAG: hypothetical protein EXR47_03645 [Dehalococcoidia bacterium]|nr:hypothetical protein [Dehalococcoidia bacterium]
MVIALQANGTSVVLVGVVRGYGGIVQRRQGMRGEACITTTWCACGGGDGQRTCPRRARGRPLPRCGVRLR